MMTRGWGILLHIEYGVTVMKKDEKAEISAYGRCGVKSGAKGVHNADESVLLVCSEW